jgi:hypothetical protein
MAVDAAALGIEFDFLCAIAKPQPDLEGARWRLRSPIDFSAVLDLAFEHHLRPHLLAAMSELAWEGMPTECKAELEGFRQHHVLRTLRLTEQLCRIAAAFSSHGIAFAAFKGAALAVDLYGDLARREYSDIDLIVAPGQMAAAETALESLGFMTDQGDRAFRRTFCAYQRQYSFAHADTDATVDLHWNFTAAALPFPLRAEEIWSDLKLVTVGAYAIPTLSDANLALLLAGHGTKEGWRSLGWICDFAAFAHRRPDLDWPALYERARKRGCGDTLLLGYALANALLGATIPRELASKVARNRRVGRIAAAIAGRLSAAPPAKSGRHHLLDLDLCDHVGDRIKAAVRLVLTPTPGDFRARPLPQALWPLYYVLRPMRLAGRAVASRVPPSLRRDGESMVGQELRAVDRRT